MGYRAGAALSLACAAIRSACTRGEPLDATRRFRRCAHWPPAIRMPTPRTTPSPIVRRSGGRRMMTRPKTAPGIATAGARLAIRLGGQISASSPTMLDQGSFAMFRCGIRREVQLRRSRPPQIGGARRDSGVCKTVSCCDCGDVLRKDRRRLWRDIDWANFRHLLELSALAAFRSLRGRDGACSPRTCSSATGGYCGVVGDGVAAGSSAANVPTSRCAV